MSSFDLVELLDTWEDLNLTGLLENGTRVEMVGCPTAFDRSALLHSMCILYIFIFVVGLAANGLVLWINIRAQHTTSSSSLATRRTSTSPIWRRLTCAYASHCPCG